MSNPIFSRNKNDYTGWIIILLIVLLVAITILAGYFFRGEEKIKLALENGKTLSFFVASYNEEKVIKGSFVVLFQTKTNRCSIISILPKTYINFGDKGHCTLETVLQKKIVYPDILEGVSNLLGTDIDYFVFIQKDNLIRLIDMVGGIEIFTDGVKYPERNVNIPPGVILLDGDKSVEYLSFVSDKAEDVEYEQLKRIQNYFSGFLKLKSDFLEQFNEQIVANWLYKMIDTDMSVTEFLIFYNEVKERYKDGIKDFSKNFKKLIVYCDKKDISGQDYVFLPKRSGEWIKKEVAEVINHLDKDLDESDSGNIVVEILNGTDIVGLAARGSRYLSSYGFDILSVGNAERDDYDNTVVVIQRAEHKARKLADLIHCDRVVTNEGFENDKIDVLLILGRDFDGRIVR